MCLALSITRKTLLTLCASLVALVFAATAQAQTARGKLRALDVPFATTPPEAVAAMLQLANVGPADVVYDLGSGDGRIVIAAVRDFGAKAGVGIDLDPKRIAEGKENALKAGVSSQVRFLQGDAFKVDFRAATVLALYMSARINRELEPRFRAQLKPGTRIVTYRFPIGDWQPVRTITVGGQAIRLWGGFRGSDDQTPSRLRVSLGKETTSPSSASVRAIWQPRRDVGVSPQARSSIWSSSSPGGSSRSAHAGSTTTWQVEQAMTPPHAPSTSR